jgi:hypothetical protein
MNKLEDEFVCREKRKFRFKIGHLLASGLSGFIAGAIFASIIFFTIYYFFIRIG